MTDYDFSDMVQDLSIKAAALSEIADRLPGEVKGRALLIDAYDIARELEAYTGELHTTVDRFMTYMYNRVRED